MLNQLTKPTEGSTVAVMKTTMGDIKIKLLPEYAPKAVENFVTHANEGYYNGLIFHRVINDFMIQGGDPTGTGCGGESIYGHAFDDEFSVDAHNLCGALSMANSGPNTNGSQFFIVQATSVPVQMMEQMKEMPTEFPAEFCDAYEEMGGTPWLDYRHTVFGQVYEGMDVVNKIAKVEVDGSDRPLEDVEIIEIICE